MTKNTILEGFFWGGEHDNNKSYNKNTQVKVTTEGFVKVYIAKRDVPKKIEIDNVVYWDIQYIALLASQLGESPQDTTLVSAYIRHMGLKTNPHEVTKAQVGLGSVDNTSDEDKPLSRASREALSEKIDDESLQTSLTTFKEEVAEQILTTGVGFPEIFPNPGQILPEADENSWVILVTGVYEKLDGGTITVPENHFAFAQFSGGDYNTVRQVYTGAIDLSPLALKTELQDIYDELVDDLSTVSGDLTTFKEQYLEFKAATELRDGFLNITKQQPLEDGEFYTLDTATAAVGDLEIPFEVLNGLLITFETFYNEWVDYRFVGNTSEGLSDVSLWKPLTVKDVVKTIIVNGVPQTPDPEGKVTVTIPDAPVQGITLNGVEIEPDSAGMISMNVSADVEQTLDPLSTNAVSSAAVASEFAQLNSKYGSALSLNTNGDEGSEVFSISLLDEDGNILSTTDEFSGGGGGEGGSTSTTKLALAKVTQNPTVKEGDEVKLTYYYDHQNTEDNSSTGLTGSATITIIAGATSRTITQNLIPDTNNQLDVTNFMAVGNNTVRVRVEVDNGENIQVSTISWRVQVITLRLTSSFDYGVLYNKGQNVTLPYNLSGSGVKTLKLYVNGLHTEDRSITTSSSNGSFNIPTSAMSHGSNSLQLVAELEVGTSLTLTSNSIYFDIAVSSGLAAPIITSRFDFLDGTIIEPGQRPYVAARQFEDFVIRYAGYNPAANQNIINVFVGGSLASAVSTSFGQRQVTSRLTQDGSFSGRIELGATTYTFGIEIETSDMNIEEPSDYLALKLSALGRSNSDTNRDEWTFENITTTFSGVQYAGDGWINNALRLMNGATATINYKPLDLTNAERLNSASIITRFRVSDVSDLDSVLISCMSGGVGFQVTAEEAKMVTAGNSEVVMKFASGRTYEIAFVSMPIAESTSSDYEKINDQMVYLYINGILSGGVQRGTGDSIYQSGSPANIIISGSMATLDLYNLRVYNNYLTSDQVLDIYMMDLDTVDDIISTYENNDIIDSEGDVTVDSLKDGQRYIIITGSQPNGMTTAKYAESMNNKDNRYDVDEILHIVKGDSMSLNWKCIGGCIRLQGTSSLAYPIKNYRIYFRSAASSSVFGQVYEGVDAQGNGGVLNAEPKPKISFMQANSRGKRPAPVNVWCLKADYAESSSSHNTGMARITNDLYIASGSPTPAQDHVAASHPWDVRTSVDGTPCYLFHRASVIDKPKFLGKYNMNNDKSTEEVFGFLDIPGYHDQSWVDTEFNGENPTECWEFLNNDYPMGMYLDDDFDTIGVDGKPDWTKVFEARFPDVQDDYEDGILGKPYYLSRWVSWVKSTQFNPTKFKNELADYMDVEHLCKYFAMTQIFGAVDQMVKNAMLGFWYHPGRQKMLGYYIFYDNDTILGVRNDGRLKYSWDLDRQTLDPELTAAAGENKYAYMGHESVLWNNLETQFATEVGEAYQSLRDKMSNDYIFQVFDTQQSGAFPERIYNLDAQYKYIEPKTMGVDVILNEEIVNTKYSYLESMQGSRASHRRWWLTNRLDLFDAKYGTGQYQLTDITWKGISDAGASVNAVMYRDYYAEFKREGTTLKREFVAKDGTFSVMYNQAANVGTIFHLYGGKYFKSLNLSNWGGFTDLTLPNLQNLEKLTLGSSSRTYTLSELVIGTKLPMLKELDVTNYTVLPTLDLSGCIKLEKLTATGCTNMGIINLPEGSPVETLILPVGLTTLKLVGLPYLENSGVVFPSGNNVRNLHIDSCPNIDWIALFDLLPNILNIRITGINMKGSREFLNRFKNLGGLNSQGIIVPNARLVGTYQMTEYLEGSDYTDFVNAFPELSIIQPAETIIHMSHVADEANATNLDNKTGYLYGTTYQPSGHINRILEKRFGCLGKQAEEGTMSICRLSNNNWNYYADGVTPATLIGSNGDVFVYEPKYWYKGVNDFYDNDARYACFSSLENPPAPAEGIKTVTLSQLTNAGKITQNRKVLIGQATLTLGTDTLYKVAEVALESFTRVRFPIVYDTGLACASFVDASGNIVEDVSIPLNSTVNMTPGMYVIKDVPQGAVSLHISYMAYIELDKVVLGHTYHNPWDFEPDWVEHKECLIGAYPSSIYTGKLSSVSSGGPQLGNISKTVLDTYTEARSLQLVSYDMYKDIANLFYTKNGRRNTHWVNGLGDKYNYSRTIGVTTFLGMGETINPNQVANGSFYYSDPETLVWLSSNKILGYEDIVSGMSEIIDLCEATNGNGIVISGRQINRTTINEPGYERFIHHQNPGSSSIGASGAASWPTILRHERFMDIISTAVNNTGSSSTYICNSQGVWQGGDRTLLRYGFDRGHEGNGVYAMNGARIRPTDVEEQTGSRIAFRGNIELVDIVSTFNAISNFL